MNNLRSTTLFELSLQLWQRVGINRKKQFLTQIALSLLVSMTEIISIGATLPFLALLAEPSKFLENPRVVNILGEIGFESSQNLIYFFTAIFIATSIMAMAMRLLMIWKWVRTLAL
jgi:ATP-binding cassette subfamily B protein